MSIKIIEGDNIRPDTPLWRYMELSKFTMLLEGRAFIPALGTLKRDADPKEASLPLHSQPHLPELLFEGKPGEEFRNWLAGRGEESRADTGRTTRESDEAPSADSVPRWLDTPYDKWLRQLSSRRAIWCWGSTPDLRPRQEPWENLAMWNSYARSGVAIKTTVQSIEKAVDASSDLKAADGIALKVRYSWQGYTIPELFDDDGRLKRPFRPFAFKNRSYKFESEVRIAFRINCHRDFPPGVVVGIDPNVLLDGGEVVLSPYLQRDEARALVSVVKRLLSNPSITVKVSEERQDVGLGINEWMDSLPNHQNEWLKRLELEAGLPHLLQEL